MIKFESHPDCKLCDLCESARNPGIPTRPLKNYSKILSGIDRALLIVGQNPGVNEDMRGESWIGYTGQLLYKFVEASGISQYCDIYLANACRCKNPQGGDIVQKHIRACRGHLEDDIQQLAIHYKEIIIFALGAKAVYSVSNSSSLNDSFKQQGYTSKVFPANEVGLINSPMQIRIFSTFHLAVLHQLRQPSLVQAIESHFALLKRYLEGNFIPNDTIEPPQLGIPVPKDLPDVVTCDIETYGILKGKEQTVFNPIKSKYIDGVDYKDQVVTVNFSWRDSADKIHSAEYVYCDGKHKSIIRNWFEAISRKKIRLTGQNFKFDLAYLACSDVVLKYWIDPRRLIVDDTLILSFLLYEQQPEKGLKELSTLFGISDYSKSKVTGKSGNAKSPWDKDLHRYNGIDGVTTLKLREELLKRIEEKYGKDSPKLSEACAWMRNCIIWDTLDLELNGSTLDVTKLKKFHDKLESRCDKLYEVTSRDYNIKLCGPGSDKPLRELFTDAIYEADLIEDSRVKYTEKEKKISIGVENANLAKEYLPRGSKTRKIISAFQFHKKKSKIVNTYTRPLLEKPRKGIVYDIGNRGMVYPSWYPIPSYFDRGGSSTETGGQTQGRFSCKQPARQTEPNSIRRCSCSRFDGGKLAEYDVNQDHLRMAALLSGDPILMETYQDPFSESIHMKTAASVFPNLDVKKGSAEYKVSKNLNFLVLFKGGPSAFQAEARRKVGVELDFEFCDYAIKTWYNKHQVYKEWQDSLIDLAAKQGYLDIPTGWSRTFGIGYSNVAAYTGEICNFIHQTPCAQVVQGIQYHVLRRFRENYMRSLICLQIYDAIFTDMYPGEEEAVDQIVDEAFADPYILHIFEEWVGREIDWCYEKKVYAK